MWRSKQGSVPGAQLPEESMYVQERSEDLTSTSGRFHAVFPLWISTFLSLAAGVAPRSPRFRALVRFAIPILTYEDRPVGRLASQMGATMRVFSRGLLIVLLVLYALPISRVIAAGF